jgi:hypothetical protein
MFAHRLHALASGSLGTLLPFLTIDAYQRRLLENIKSTLFELKIQQKSSFSGSARKNPKKKVPLPPQRSLPALDPAVVRSSSNGWKINKKTENNSWSEISARRFCGRGRGLAFAPVLVFSPPR